MRTRLLLLITSQLLLVSGCATIGDPPDYSGSASELSAGVTPWQEQERTAPVASMHDLLPSPELKALVDEALANNPGLQQTLLALEQSRYALNQSKSERYPELEAGLSAGRSEDTDTQYTGFLTLSWQLDLWQQIEDGVRASEQSLLGQQATLQAARDTLAAEVMKSWLALISARHTLDIEQQRLATLELNENLIMQRYQRGLGTLEDLDSARSSTFSSRATVREQKQAIEQQQRALNTLLGRVNDDRHLVPDQYPDIPQALADLPEQTLARRPDLQAAWHAIEAARYNARVTYKDMLPGINLQAALEDVASNPSGALLNDPVWSLLGQLTAPLFQGGKLKAAAEIAELDAAIQFQSYRETLLTAVEEVRNALAREQELADRQSFIASALASQQLTLERYQEKYRAGNATILELLSVQQQTYDLESQLDTLTFNRLDNRITLALALGLGVNQ